MKHQLYKMRFLIILIVLAVSGCSSNMVSSQYDLKLKAHTKNIICDRGGVITQAEITIDSRRYQSLDSEHQIFLSYHILDSNENTIINDGIRTVLTPIPARGIGKETVDILVPNNSGEYLVDIDLVEENVTWFSAQGMSTLRIPLTVKESIVADYSQVSLTSSVSHVELQSQKGFELPITIQNNSEIVLCNSGAEKLLVSYYVKDLAGNILEEGERFSLPHHVLSSEDTLLNISPQAQIFNVPGTYELEIGLLIEGTAWLHEWGMKPLTVSVTVK